MRKLCLLASLIVLLSNLGLESINAQSCDGNEVLGLGNAIQALQILGSFPPTDQFPCDVNGDTQIGLAEAIYSLQIVAGTRSDDSFIGWEGPPVTTLDANTGTARTVESLDRITLDGTRSRSPEGAIVSWSWRQVEGPTVELSGADTARPSFQAPQVDAGDEDVIFAFELTVQDATGTTASTISKVKVTPPSGFVETTSFGKIRRAMETGALDRGTAVLYLAYAVFGDPRLPEGFQGTDVDPSGSWAMAAIAEEYATLSPEEQAAVLPFLLPPSSPDSWYMQNLTAQVQSGHTAATEPAAATPAGSWLTVSGTHVVVWYHPTLANGAAIASGLLNEAEKTIWTKLLSLLGEDHMPLPDGAVKVPHGPDGTLDIYLVHGITPYGYFLPYSIAPTPGYICLRDTLPLKVQNAASLAVSVAHEIMHGCQYSFEFSFPYSFFPWIYEATATWAEDYVYPELNSEHEYASDYLDSMRLEILKDRGTRIYGTYLFFQYISKIDSPEYIPRTFHLFENHGPPSSVDQAFLPPESLKDYWGDFLIAAYNRNGLDWFRQEDHLEDEAVDVGSIALPVNEPGEYEMLNGGGYRIKALSGLYYHFVPKSPVRSIFVLDGVKHKLSYQAEGWSAGQQVSTIPVLEPPPEPLPEATTQAVMRLLVNRGGEWIEASRPDEYGIVQVCLEDPDFPVDELTVILGNSGAGFQGGDLLEVSSIQEPPAVLANNVGCYEWQGQITGHTTSGSVIQETSAQVTFRISPFSEGTDLIFDVVEATVHWSISGTDEYDCAHSGSADWNLTADDHAGSLTIHAATLPGPLHHAYTGYASAENAPHTIKCSGEPADTYPESITWWVADHDGFIPVLSADGVNASGTNESDDNMTYQWTLHSVSGR